MRLAKTAIAFSALGAALAAPALLLGCSRQSGVVACPDGSTFVSAEGKTTINGEKLSVVEIGCVGEDRRAHGPVLAWADSRLISVRNFDNGQLNGTAITWNTNGHLSVVSAFQNGQPVGTTQIWNPAGIVVHKTVHHDPTSSSSETYYADGRIRSRYEEREQELHGLYESWHLSGDLHSRGLYSTGRKQGTWTCVGKDGLSLEAHFDGGAFVSHETPELTKEAFDLCTRSISREDGPQSVAQLSAFD